MRIKQIIAICTLVSGVALALIGQDHLFGEPWMHYISLVGILATAVGGALGKFEREWNGEDRRQP